MIQLILLLNIIGAAGITAALILLFYAQKKRQQAKDLFVQSDEKLKNVKQHIINEKREALLKLKDELFHKRKEFDLELKRDKLELERLQAKLNSKHDSLDKKEEHIDQLRLELQQKERSLSHIEDTLRSSENKLKTLYNDLLAKLERISNMSRDEAKQTLLDTLDAEVRLSSQKLIQKIEDEARQTAKERSIDITVTAMQRYTTDQVSIHSSGLVHLPNEEMKGRIIGKEGRNIKSLEMATGMEFIIGDSPDITISGFNPIRREVARLGLVRRKIHC